MYMNLILVCLNNFQEYILTNVEQLIKLNHKNIFVITNKIFFNEFLAYKNNIILVDSDELDDEYNFYNITKLDKSFRNGFWTLTSLRFFKIYMLIKKYNLKDVFHIENDVLLYYNIDRIINGINKNYVYLPFDTYNRDIASIIYIPSENIFKNILDNYDLTKNDMENFSIIKQKTGLIKNFPIFPNIHAKSDEEKYVSQNFDKFNFIFDAAAIGQFIGGVDPRNDISNTIGFINETCVIKYNNYKITFMNEDNMIKPYIEIENIIYPIFNLHIHSKNLIKYINNENNENIFDIVICLGPNDKDIINQSILYTKKNIIGYRNIYVISYDASISVENAVIIDENIFPFNKDTFINIFGNNNRNGWYLQQLLKLYAGIVIPGILDKYLIIDSDTFFLKPTKFIDDNGKIIITTGTEYNKHYFLHMNRLHYTLKKIHPLSGISHHCLFITKYIKELMLMIENNFDNNEPFWKIFIDMLDRNEYNMSGCSEYELYFTYMNLYHSNQFITRELKWQNLNYLDINNTNDNQFVSIHWYNRK